jgi:hypothetical protein
MPTELTLILLDGRFAVCRLEPFASLPPWATARGFFAITRTADELSIVCCQDDVPATTRCERGWHCLRVAGTIPFSAVGVLASLAGPLADAAISVFVVSTFDTDYLYIKENDLARAIEALRSRGHTIISA